MLEAFQSVRDDLTSKKQVEVDQTSASKPGTSQAAVTLDLTTPRQPRTTSNVEQMEVDYGPALPPHLGVDHHIALDQPSSPSEEPSKKASDRPKNTLTLIGSMMLTRGLPRINTMMNLMNLGCHLLNQKNMLTRLNIR